MPATERAANAAPHCGARTAALLDAAPDAERPRMATKYVEGLSEPGALLRCDAGLLRKQLRAGVAAVAIAGRPARPRMPAPFRGE